MTGEYVPSDPIIFDALREFLCDEDDPDGSGGARTILTAHDARITSLAAEEALRDAAGACGSGKTNWTKAWLTARAERLKSEREAGDE